MAGEDELNVVPIREDIYSKAPQSAVHPSQIASPYNFLANAMDKGAEALDKIGEVAGERAGYQAAKEATIGPDGQIQISKAPMFGKAMDAYSRALKVGALAEAEGAIRREEIRTREQFRDNPEGYSNYITEYGKKMQKQYTDAAGPDVGVAVRRTIEDTGTKVYRNLQNEKEALDLHRTTKDIEDQIKAHSEDLLTKVRGGITGPELDKNFDAIKTLQNEKVKNPRMAYSEKQAQYEMDHLAGEVGAERFLYETDQIYKNPDPEKGGAKNALEHAESILTDQRIQMPTAERYKYYSKAKNEIHINEAIRKQDVNELKAEINQYIYDSTVLGARADPQQIEAWGKAAVAMGAPSLKLHLESTFARHSLQDGWDRQPLGKQAADYEAGVNSTTTGGLSHDLLQHVKKWESFEPVAKFDYKGYSVGYGSPAEKGQTTTEPEAAAVVAQRLTVANRKVEAFAPEAPKGVKDALTSLTNNAGTDWMNAGLGKAVKEGNYTEARIRFLQYVNATDERTGKTSQPKGLINRRREEAEWFNPGSPGASGAGVTPEESTQGVSPSHPQAIPGGVTKGRMASRTDGGSSDWLDANRRGTILKEARGDWDASVKDWQEKEIFPNQNRIDEIAYAAKVIGDHDLQTKMGRDLDVMQQVRDARVMPVPVQESQINELKARATVGGYEETGRAVLLKHREANLRNIESGLKTDAPGTAAIAMPEKAQVPTALDLDNPEKTIQGMNLRERNTKLAQETWQTGPYSALGKQDLEQVQTRLENTQDPKAKAAIFGAVTSSIQDPGIRNATLKAIGGKDVSLSAQAYAGGLSPQDPKVASSIFAGEAKLKIDPRLIPQKATELGHIKIGDWDDEMDKRMPATIFNDTDRSNPQGKYATFKQAIKYRYADLADLDNHDVSGELKEDRLQRAINDVTGGIVTHGDFQTITPERGMSQEKFDAKIWGFTEDDLKGVTTQNGRPVTVDDLRRQAHFESVAEGRYHVLLGTATDYGSEKPSKQPVYAYKDGKPFVLDFKDRPDEKVGPPKIDLVPQPAFDSNSMGDTFRSRKYPRGEFEERWYEPHVNEPGGMLDKMNMADVPSGNVEMRGEPRGGPHGPRTRIDVKQTPEEQKTAADFLERGDHEGAASELAKQLGIHDIEAPGAARLREGFKELLKEHNKTKLKLPDLPQE